VITLDVLAELAALAYLVIFALAAFDVIVPILPSETAVVLGGVLAWQNRLHLVFVLLAAAAGAILGDHLSYGIGRGSQRLRRVAERRGTNRKASKIERLEAWAAHRLEAHGPVVLIVARFIPGGRTASTFASGRLHFPLPMFTLCTVVAGMLWAGFGASLGYLGGTTFEHNTLLATGLGVAVGTGVAFLIELVMSRSGRRLVLAVDEDGSDGKDDLAA
jgi:membrane protein DedA with SNARE-associated domain